MSLSRKLSHLLEGHWSQVSQPGHSCICFLWVQWTRSGMKALTDIPGVFLKYRVQPALALKLQQHAGICAPAPKTLLAENAAFKVGSWCVSFHTQLWDSGKPCRHPGPRSQSPAERAASIHLGSVAGQNHSILLFSFICLKMMKSLFTKMK